MDEERHTRNLHEEVALHCCMLATLSLLAASKENGDFLFLLLFLSLASPSHVSPFHVSLSILSLSCVSLSSHLSL